MTKKQEDELHEKYEQLGEKLLKCPNYSLRAINICLEMFEIIDELEVNNGRKS